eukprot:TRINITY_DN9201_c0_g1::TRINITY_DN9201_c0_g1_i1::g.12538::m.12538 TRINITY_DN9201_c0_g1::TRINITY_DN9201_c0_g1_i1::g.12538  ORF type:complete len:153 (+),score=16.24 TRINITY_DN9201_c0_g1_i1:51-461(+)
MGAEQSKKAATMKLAADEILCGNCFTKNKKMDEHCHMCGEDLPTFSGPTEDMPPPEAMHQENATANMKTAPTPCETTQKAPCSKPCNQPCSQPMSQPCMKSGGATHTASSTGLLALSVLAAVGVAFIAIRMRQSGN